MRIKEIIRRARLRPVADDGERASALEGVIFGLEGSRRGIALVIAEPALAAAVSELYQAHGYEVFVPETPLDVIDTLVTVGDEVCAVLISSEATWANGLREFIADEFPKIDRVLLVS